MNTMAIVELMLQNRQISMLTLTEVLSDFGLYAGFDDVTEATINSRGECGESPLHWMAILGDPAGIKLLIEAGADIDTVDDEGNTPLHRAVSARQADAVKFLIERGAGVNQRNRAGLTPLDLAKLDGYSPTMEWFAKGKVLGSD
jgi:uncharacterized protein